jgi:hypothetical protein
MLDLGQAEVENLCLPALVDKDVGRLDVTMHDALGVCRLQGIRHLDANPAQPADLDGPRLDEILQGLAFQELHDDEVLTLVLIDGVDGTDIGVVQGRGGASLTLEAFQSRLVLGQVRGQELQGYPAT